MLMGEGILLTFCRIHSYTTDVILRSRALARRLEGSAMGACGHPSRLAVKNGEHLRRTITWLEVTVSGREGLGAGAAWRLAKLTSPQTPFPPRTAPARRGYPRRTPSLPTARGCRAPAPGCRRS